MRAPAASVGLSFVPEAATYSSAATPVSKVIPGAIAERTSLAGAARVSTGLPWRTTFLGRRRPEGPCCCRGESLPDNRSFSKRGTWVNTRHRSRKSPNNFGKADGEGVPVAQSTTGLNGERRGCEEIKVKKQNGPRRSRGRRKCR